MTIENVAVSYLHPTQERAYYYLHQVPEGSPARNVRGDRREITVHDARSLDPTPRLEREGVELVAFDGAPKDERDAAHVEEEFYPRVEAMVAEKTGASRVVAFDHNLRSSGRDEADGAIVQSPVRLVHNDYTEHSAPQRVRDLLGDEAEDLLAHRFAVINVWKPLHGPVHELPLAVCDAQTIDPNDMIETDLRYPDRTGEIYSFAYSEAHRWLYFPTMSPDETMLLKCYDSARDVSRFTAHTAIDDPDTPPDAPARQSIEVRTLAFFAG